MTARGAISALLAFVAGLLAVAAVVCWSLDHGVVDEQAFADTAVAALQRDSVRNAVSDEVFAQVAPQVPAAVASPDHVRAVVDRLVASPTFRRVYRQGAVSLSRALFEEPRRDAVLRIDLARVVRPVSPQLAELVGDREVIVVSLRSSEALDRTRQAADLVGTLAITLPFFAAAALIAALLLAPRRLRALAAAGAGAALGGAVVLVALPAARSRVVDFVDLRSDAATRAIWDVYAADLQTIAIVAVVAGLVVAAGGLVAGRAVSS